MFYILHANALLAGGAGLRLCYSFRIISNKLLRKQCGGRIGAMTIAPHNHREEAELPRVKGSALALRAMSEFCGGGAIIVF